MTDRPDESIRGLIRALEAQLQGGVPNYAQSLGDHQHPADDGSALDEDEVPIDSAELPLREVDTTQQPPSTSRSEMVEDASLIPVDSAEVPMKPADPTKEQRFTIARTLLWIVAGMSIAAGTVSLAVGADEWDQFSSLVPTVLAPLQTLLAAAIGWYFGGRSSEK